MTPTERAALADAAHEVEALREQIEDAAYRMAYPPLFGYSLRGAVSATRAAMRDAIRVAETALGGLCEATPGGRRCAECGDHYADAARWLPSDAASAPTRVAVEVDGMFLCPRCWACCDDCGHILRCGENSFTRRARTICYGCAANYTFCANCGDECDEDTDEDGNGRCCAESHDDDGTIGGYHSHRFSCVRGAWTAQRKRFIGVELEVEVCRSADMDAAAQRVLASGTGVVLESDGSLDHGFEIITQPMGMDAQRVLWTALLSAHPSRVKGLHSHDTRTCGLHVHVSRKGVSSFTLAKAVVFVNDPKNKRLIEAVARRYAPEGSSHGFANMKAKTLSTAHRDEHDRYQAVNLCHSGTIEFRIFRGSVNYDAVLAAIQFSNAVLCFAAETSARTLTTAAFMAYLKTPAMQEDTDILRAYLLARAPDLTPLVYGVPAPAAPTAEAKRKKHHASNHVGRYHDCELCTRARLLKPEQ